MFDFALFGAESIIAVKSALDNAGHAAAGDSVSSAANSAHLPPSDVTGAGDSVSAAANSVSVHPVDHGVSGAEHTALQPTGGESSHDTTTYYYEDENGMPSDNVTYYEEETTTTYYYDDYGTPDPAHTTGLHVGDHSAPMDSTASHPSGGEPGYEETTTYYYEEDGAVPSDHAWYEEEVTTTYYYDDYGSPDVSHTTGLSAVDHGTSMTGQETNDGFVCDETTYYHDETTFVYDRMPTGEELAAPMAPVTSENMESSVKQDAPFSFGGNLLAALAAIVPTGALKQQAVAARTGMYSDEMLREMVTA